MESIFYKRWRRLVMIWWKIFFVWSWSDESSLWTDKVPASVCWGALQTCLKQAAQRWNCFLDFLFVLNFICFNIMSTAMDGWINYVNIELYWQDFSLNNLCKKLGKNINASNWNCIDYLTYHSLTNYMIFIIYKTANFNIDISCLSG